VPTLPVEVMQVTAMVGGAMTMEQLELLVAASPPVESVR
jgi:hypothetical protein